MRTALLITGQFRNAKYCFTGIKKNILDFYNPDVFISGWTNPDSISPGGYFGVVPDDDCTIPEILEMYKPVSFDFEHYDSSGNGYFKNQAKILDQKYPDVETKTQNVLSMWYKRHRVNELKKRWEFQKNIKYDLVILARFDLEILETPNITFLKQNSIYIPEGFDFSGGLNDLLAISDSDGINYYTDLYNRMYNYRVEAGVHFSAHAILKHHLDISYLSIERFLLNFKIRGVNVWQKNNTRMWKIFDDKLNSFYYQSFESVEEKTSVNGYDFLYWENFHCDFSHNGNIYEMWDCELKEGDVVVDLGSNVGFFTHYASMKASKVISVDGSPEAISCLIENCKDRSNVKALIASALGKDSFQSHLWSYTQKESPLKFTIEELMNLFGLERIDFLKVDIEGGEYNLFKNIDQSTLDKIDRIAIEAHDDSENETFFLPGKIRHTYFHEYGGGHQTFLYFVTPR